jgi:hypothetical protein
MANRFENGSLAQRNGITLLRFDYQNGRHILVRTTTHAKEKYEERNINLNEVCGAIVALGKEIIYEASKQGEDIAILDKKGKQTLAIILTFEVSGNEIQARIRTLIKKEFIYIKENTRIYKLDNFKGGF